MGFYQLSRLYYSFANSQIHSNKGYPKCIFIIMIIFGVLIMINLVILSIIFHDGPYMECGLDSKWQFYYVSIFPVSVYKAVCIWSLLGYCWLFCIWDIATLVLYWWKIRTVRDMIKNKGDGVYKRVLSILHRIFILTLFYQISTLFGSMVTFAEYMTDFAWISGLSWSVPVWYVSLSYSISMYLMMEHNGAEYITFLKIISKIRLNFVCCGCRHIVNEQLLEHDGDADLEVAEGRRREDDTTINDTRDISLPQKITMESIDLTVSTETSHSLPI